MLNLPMPAPAPQVVRAWFESTTQVVVELDHDWPAGSVPKFTLGPDAPELPTPSPAPPLAAARMFGYYFSAPGEITFALPIEPGCQVNPARDAVYIGGDFNGWDAAIGHEQWRLNPGEIDRVPVLLWRGPSARFFKTPGQQFKLVTNDFNWLIPPDDAPNVVRTNNGHLNRALDAARTGRQLWALSLEKPIDLSNPGIISLVDEPSQPGAPLLPGHFFYDLKTNLPLGAIVRGEETIFRLFAPRAQRVTLALQPNDGDAESIRTFDLTRQPEADGNVGVWEIAFGQNLHGWFYWFHIDGAREGLGRFDPTPRVLDPYALASVDRDGPGIVLDREWIGAGDHDFATPPWHDLIIVEAHVRDLIAQAPIEASPEERRGFTGLKRWIESPDFYLHHLGVNCVELQPIQEFDNKAVDEYHWGYMTNNFFSPESSYSLDPTRASGVREFQEVVRAFHRRGIAVLLDVVYNHQGEPAHLLLVDRLYYFEQDATGKLANWSGCGNDLRARSAMARRLIIDSCLHLLHAYGVDGFRFDLAELLGVDVLRDIEVALKRAKPNVILIAEPWSFRGHISSALRDTGWASWNDGYRNFVRDYLGGTGDARQLEYFLRGSPWFFAKWPAQTVNYTESHDDRSWLDMITDNPGHDGFMPTPRDQRRTRLMASVLFMSIGIPMLAAGQDFLRSKRGVNNTYLRGDLNALDYRRIHRFLSTHTYFAEWIAFRRSEGGALLRQQSRPTEGFFQFLPTVESNALGVVYNADHSQGPRRLLFAINPTADDVQIPLGANLAGGNWRQLADHDRFYCSESQASTVPVTPELFVPAVGCGLWCDEG